MNKIPLKKYYLILLLLAVMVGCKDNVTSDTSDKNIETSSDSDSSDDLEVKTSNFSENDNALICLWSKVGLRDIAGRKGAKYLATIYFGETVKFLGEKETGSDNKEYLKIELSDGAQGWVYEHLFAENGKLAVLKKPLAIYKRPDVMEFVGNKFDRGDIVVLLDQSKGEWEKVTGFEKKNEGWIKKSDDFVYDDLDIKLAILYNRALNEDNASKKNKKLKLIMDNPAFQQSNFIDIVQKSLVVDDSEAYGMINDPDGYTNMREGKGTDYAIVKKVFEDEKFIIQRNNGDWSLIRLADGTSGWIHSSRIKIVRE
ncbi:SH3 domain-containing protein [Olleya sp. HaHaR_3_96]|uniref:SH3 domain-containing protein n=1 Tax=Olleya sp. HaHaR_3_96 TaxID=2745560 RepID=UPI001C4F2197|nr:SH3 domain-containing protein [Olleya sp. HaHaR_3_96]QXP58780.1 SH3 domain-containing protein [Olleya sp. HaHaR_3_96]